VNAVSFLGWYGYPPNEAAALELMRAIMPAIRSAGGPTPLVLIGAQPTPSMVRVAAETGAVSITGQVADVVPALRAAGILVVPVRAGGGTRVKILEAMAARVPVVSTRLGIEGLSLTPGTHVLLAETPSDFASAVGRLATDHVLREALTDAAARFVAEHHSTATVGAAVGAALSQLPGLTSTARTGSHQAESAG
jgi:glycosyltransferase involved in cell wall biosynthesis